MAEPAAPWWEARPETADAAAAPVSDDVIDAPVVPTIDAAPAAVAPAPVPEARVAAPVPTPAAVVPTAPASMPAFTLPLDSLQAVAQSAGLQWVNSDAEKIRAVQAAMAAEPAPVHVPRERKPMPKIDEGALVLVETRKDLSQFKLPFETGAGSQPPV